MSFLSLLKSSRDHQAGRQIWAYTAAVVAVLGLSVYAAYRQHAESTAFRGKTFRIGVESNPPHFDWNASDGAFGFAVDVFNEAASRAGVKLQWVYCTHGSREALEKGRVDIWPIGYYRPGQYPGFYQPAPWSEDQHVLIWDRGRFDGKGRDWDGMRVAVTDRIVIRESATKLFPNSELVRAPTRRETIAKLCSGAADVAFLDVRVLESSLLERPTECAGKKFGVQSLPELIEPLTMFAKAELAPLADLLRDRIDDMASDGTLTSIADRWFVFRGSEFRTVTRMIDQKRQLTILGLVCLFMVFVIVTLIVMIRRMRASGTAAERARRLQSEFLTNVSHEVRTPMNGVLGAADLLFDSPLNEAQRDHLATIQECAQNQLELINQILDQSKIDSGVLLLEFIPFSPARLMRQVEMTFRAAAKRAGLEFRVELQDDLPNVLRGDALRIRQILNNLVNNAIKFTETGTVTLRMSCERMRSIAHLTIEVADTGIGVPVEMQQSIFEKFHQGDTSTTRRFGGTGLGLSISRQLAEMMGGNLTVCSEPGVGSVFTLLLTLPLAPAEQHQPEPGEPAGTSKDLGKLAVLLVEDNAVNQRVAAKMLRNLGASVDIAATGVEAVALCKNKNYDAVLMDCHMPEMDGYEATAAIRNLNSAVRDVPIVALTAGVSSEERHRALAAGMNGFLSKPVSRDDILEALGRALSNSEPRP